jgi:hypothetical protein
MAFFLPDLLLIKSVINSKVVSRPVADFRHESQPALQHHGTKWEARLDELVDQADDLGN